MPYPDSRSNRPPYQPSHTCTWIGWTVWRQNWNKILRYKQRSISCSTATFWRNIIWCKMGCCSMIVHLVISPKSPWRTVILDELHASPTAGYFSYLKTVQRVNKLFYWPHMQSDIFAHTLRSVKYANDTSTRPWPQPGCCSRYPYLITYGWNYPWILLMIFPALTAITWSWWSSISSLRQPISWLLSTHIQQHPWPEPSWITSSNSMDSQSPSYQTTTGSSPVNYGNNCFACRVLSWNSVPAITPKSMDKQR